MANSPRGKKDFPGALVTTATLNDSFGLVQFEGGGFGEGFGSVGGHDDGVFDADVAW